MSVALPEPYASVRVLPPDWHGWFHNGDQMAQLFGERRFRCIVELGSWLGLSTVFLARFLLPDGKLYAVDTWLGSREHYRLPECVHRLPVLFQQFLSNMVHAGLCHQIVPIRMTTLEAARALNVTPDLVYVDASHDTEDVKQDVVHWYPRLADGGILCGDDWHWDSVRAGVLQAADALGVRVEGERFFWRIL